MFTNLRRPPAHRTLDRRRARPRLEPLDRRDVPVVGLSPLVPVLELGVLTVMGDANNNTIEVTLSGSSIKVLGKSFSASQVKQIVIAGEAGNDTIRVSESIKVPTVLYGGWGNDLIEGGGGKDVIYGGSGKDTLRGRGSDDDFFTGAGSDTVDGGPGSDAVLDASSSDTITSASSLLHDDSVFVAYTGFTGDVVKEILRLVNQARGPDRGGTRWLWTRP